MRWYFCPLVPNGLSPCFTERRLPPLWRICNSNLFRVTSCRLNLQCRRYGSSTATPRSAGFGGNLALFIRAPRLPRAFSPDDFPRIIYHAEFDGSCCRQLAVLRSVNKFSNEWGLSYIRDRADPDSYTCLAYT